MWFHRHTWGKWYYEEKVDHTVRICLKCDDYEKSSPTVDRITRRLEGAYVHTHWASDVKTCPGEVSITVEKIEKLQEYLRKTDA
jgi:hypothetical protein